MMPNNNSINSGRTSANSAALAAALVAAQKATRAIIIRRSPRPGCVALRSKPLARETERAEESACKAPLRMTVTIGAPSAVAGRIPCRCRRSAVPAVSRRSSVTVIVSSRPVRQAGRFRAAQIAVIDDVFVSSASTVSAAGAGASRNSQLKSCRAA